MSTLTSESLGGISNKPSTRLHAPPGGASSFSLSHDDGPQPGVSTTSAKTRIRDVNGAPGILADSTLKNQAPLSPSKQNMKASTQTFSINDGDDSSRFQQSRAKIVNQNSMGAAQPAPTSPYIKKGYHNQHSDIFGTRSSLDATSPPPHVNISLQTNTEASSEFQDGYGNPRSPSLSSVNQKVLTSPDFGFGKDEPPAAQVAYENAVFPDELNEVPVTSHASEQEPKAPSPSKADPSVLQPAGSSKNLNPTVFGFGGSGPRRRAPPGGASSIVLG